MCVKDGTGNNERGIEDRTWSRAPVDRIDETHVIDFVIEGNHFEAA